MKLHHDAKIKPIFIHFHLSYPISEFSVFLVSAHVEICKKKEKKYTFTPFILTAGAVAATAKQSCLNFFSKCVVYIESEPN